MVEFALYAAGVVGWLLAYHAHARKLDARRERDRLARDNRSLTDGLRYQAEQIDELNEQLDVLRIKERFRRRQSLPN